jgi:GcrA cell cycle regulator
MLMVTFRRPQPPAEDIPIYNGRGCTLLELSQGKCRWPISNPGAQDFCFCGNEPVKGLGTRALHIGRSVDSAARPPPAPR